MQHNFKVGDKVKVKPYSEFDFSDELYEYCQDDVQAIADVVFEILEIDHDGDLCLDTKGFIGFSYFYVHPSDVTPVSTSTKKPRPHAELIKQWADDDSLEIEYTNNNGECWHLVPDPIWEPIYQYRIKPKTVTKWKWAYNTGKSDTTLITTAYFANEDDLREGRVVEKAIKLEWTAKEFEI